MKWDEIHDRAKEITGRTVKSLLDEVVGEVKDEREGEIGQRLRDSDFLFTELKRRGRYDYREAFRKLKRKQQRRNNFRMIGVSAAAACVIWVACLMVIQYGERLKEPVMMALRQESIEPGRVRAILMKADGEEVVLDSRSRMLAEGNGMKIAVDSIGLQYEAGENLTKDSSVCNTLIVPRGGMFHLTLADGTKVWLNADSKLVYPVAFSGDMREVRLSGEAYFDVERNPAKPFTVKTERGEIRVLGTEFNVKVYSDEVSVTTTLVTGSVSFANEAISGMKLTPGHQMVYDEVAGRAEIRAVNVQHYVGWRDNQLSFQHETLENIMRALARWYDVEVVFLEPSLKQLVFSGNLDKYASIDAFFKLFELGSNVRFDVKGKTVLIREEK